MKPVVYTAGPIAALSWDAAVDWRYYVSDRMSKYCDVRSPMRGKEFLSKKEVMPLTAGELEPIASQHAIVIRDHNDVEQADVIIANLLPSVDIGRASIGTAFELGWAYMTHTPAIVVMKDDNNPNWHPFVLEAAYVVVDSLRDAVDFAFEVLNLDDWR